MAKEGEDEKIHGKIEEKKEIEKIKKEKDKEKKNIKDKENEKIFENFKEKYIMKSKYKICLKEKDFRVLKKIFFVKNESELNISKLIRLYSINSNDIDNLKIKTEKYENKIDSFEYEIAEEFSIEKIF